MALGMEVSLGPGHIVLDGDPAPLPQKRSELPIFVPCLLCQTAVWIKMALGREVSLGRNDIVLHGDPAPPKRHSPQFLANVYCGQMAVCFRIPLVQR